MENELLDGFFLRDVRVEPSTGTVIRNGQTLHLPSKSAEVLFWLARHPRHLVSRQQLLEQVWGDGAGSREALRHAIGEIRHALDDSARTPRFIQTVPTRGYRLLVKPTGIAAPHTRRKDDTSLWGKLLRHGVVQAVAAYALAGWALIQVAGETFVNLGLPEWTVPFVIFTVVGGFPVVVLLSWFLEMSGGRVETDEGQSGGGLWDGLGRNYLAIVAAYFIAAGGAGVYQATVGFGVPASGTAVAANQRNGARQLDELLPIADNSIAVLRFANLDGSERSSIFANGLSEDILDATARVPGLLVSPRGDSWTLPVNATSQNVRDRLRVAYYLEGSVRIEGDEITVVAQLIDSSTGFHIQSKRILQTLTKFHEIQAEVTDLIIATLRVSLPEEVQKLAPLAAYESDVDAYVAYRRGTEILDQPRSLASIKAAAEEFRTSLAIDPHYSAAHSGLCSATVAQYQITGESEVVAAAERFCANALANGPNLPLVHRANAFLYFRTGRLDDAERHYQSALEINDQDALAMIGLARIYRRQNRLDEAATLLARAIDLQPGNWRAFNSLGALYFSQGRYADAAESYERVRLFDPDNFVVLDNLATSQMMAGKFAESLETFQKALKIDANPVTYTNIGILHYYLGDIEQSISMHGLSAEMAPQSASSHVNLGDALFAAGRTIEAEAAFASGATLARDRLRSDPGNPEILSFLAWSETMIGNVDEGERLVAELVRIAPDDPFSHYFHGLIALRSGQTETAMKAIGTAVKLGYSTAMLKAEPYMEPLRGLREFDRLIASSGGQ